MHNKSILTFLAAILSAVLFSSCGDEKGPTFVINELMASNKTGIIAPDGKMHDWIEICNVSGKTMNLKGYAIEKDSGSVRYELPDKELKANECILIYASKKDVKGALSCGFKLSAKGDSIQLVAPHGTIVSKVGYNKLKDDQSLRLTKKGKYKKTFYQTPGFANDDKGMEQYYQLMESQRRDALKIWECCDKSRNRADVWIEVKNTSSQPVNLAAYSVVCAKDSAKDITLPEKTLAPGELYVVTDKDGVLHGQCVILQKGETFVDGINTTKAYMGSSIGRQDNKIGFYYFDTPTPGSENTAKGYRKVNDEPDFNIKAGAYARKCLVIKPDSKKTIHYTVDGSVPTMESPVMKDSLVLNNPTTLRAIAVDSTNMASPVKTATYILGMKHDLPLVCITVDNAALFNYQTGIYADGPGGGGEFPHMNANYWKNWEKFAHVEFIDGKEGFSYDCGLEIFGGFSRALPKKSFKIKLHGKYGQSRVDYDLYNCGKKDHSKTFVLRSGSQDYTGIMMRDEYFTTLMKQDSPHMYIQRNRPVVLYINGIYWGIYYIREKINADYVANHLHVDPDSTTMLMSHSLQLIGTKDEYNALVNYAIANDTRRDDVYSYLEKRVDFESLIDFKQGEFFCSNTDAGNIRFFKSSDPRCDNRWHWIYYDLDASFGCFKPLHFYIFGNTLNASAGSTEPQNALICQLLKNPKFRQLFLERWAYHRQHALSVKQSLKLFDEMVNNIKPEMGRECLRWPKLSYKHWEENVKRFRDQIINRPAVLDTMFINGMALTAAEKKKYFPHNP